MKLKVITTDETIYNENIDYVVVKDSEGEFAILDKHVPIVHIIEEGYIRIANKKSHIYIYLYESVLKYENDLCLVLAQEAHAGLTPQEGKNILIEIRKERKNTEKLNQGNNAKLEKDLRESILNTKAGSL